MKKKEYYTFEEINTMLDASIEQSASNLLKKIGDKKKVKKAYA